MTQLPSTHAGTVRVLDGEEYWQCLLALTTMQTRRVAVMQYILDTRPEADVERRVVHLLRGLSLAAARGVEVRVLLHDYSPDPDLHVHSNLPGALFLRRRGVDVRFFRPDPDEQRQVLHAKCALFDDDVALVGSQNWSPGAFGSNREQAVVLSDCVGALRSLWTYFDGMWMRSKEPVP